MTVGLDAGPVLGADGTAVGIRANGLRVLPESAGGVPRNEPGSYAPK